jgi:hypothetical protein
LIVCEGSKTEVNYFEEIRQESRLSSVDVKVIHSPHGTEPRQVVEGAEAEFKKTKAFEKIYAVFDRDQHQTYANAIAMASARNGRFKNDEKKAVSFEPVVSVPCFELWLLLHFVNQMAPIHRHDALAQVQQHLPGYEKGNEGTFAATVEYLEDATQRAVALKAQNERLPGTESYTDVHELVAELRKFAPCR